MSRAHSSHLTEADVQALAGPILQRRLSDFTVGDVEVKEEVDFDGAHIFRVVVGVAARVPADDLVDALVEIQQGVRQEGDERWVYLNTLRPEAGDESLY